MPKVLLVEDEEELLVKLQRRLEKDGFTTDTASDGLVGLGMLEQYQYDVAVLDWNLPGITGPEIISRFRTAGGRTPILMLTGKDEIADKTVGFKSGADDYLTKPFHPDELMLRLRALCRRPTQYQSRALTLGALTIDVERTVASMNGQELNLQRLEFRLLEFLVQNSGRTYTAEMLLDRVWPADSEASVETVRGYIKTLRKKLTAAGDKPNIRNIYGLGYKIDLSND